MARIKTSLNFLATDLFVATCICFPLLAFADEERALQITVVDSMSQKPLAARAYLHNSENKPLFFSVDAPSGSAVRYEKQNWINPQSVEYHTTLSPHPARAVVPSGSYTLTVERGQTYRSSTQPVVIADKDVQLRVSLERWCDPVSAGWYSGDTHIHRTLEELKNVIQAEDLNVAMPLTYWVTRSATSPAAGDKNLTGEIPKDLIRVDEQHVIWPRNTEYEIFTVGDKRHTLGALFVLGHSRALDLGVPIWRPVVERERSRGVLFDMDKLDWPFAMLLPTLGGDMLYELANNHLWRTEFAFRKWNTSAPAYIQPPFGTAEGGERQWIDYTHGMYYSLLNCGLRIPPTAGTANGVHPVPAGFGRVYVHLPDGFEYQHWLDGLREGRSFVTTGPMLYATADSRHAGHEFRFSKPKNQPHKIPVSVEVLSEFPVSYGELVVNGEPQRLLRFSNAAAASSTFRSVLETNVEISQSGWFAIRVWEERPNSRHRFAHSAPWYVRIDDQPVTLRREEKEYLLRRMNDEIQRSRGVLDEPALAEYQRGIEFYERIPIRDDGAEVSKIARPLGEGQQRSKWLENMLGAHRFSADELRRATGMTYEEAQREFDRFHATTLNSKALVQAKAAVPSKIQILPYPGGRHPRRGFLDGAIDPQRETKISIFPPWANGGYVVVDVPEAIFSNLGLTYLAHRHIDTIWTANGVNLAPLEWNTAGDTLRMERKLPNGIRFGSIVKPLETSVFMEMWLTNGSSRPLTGLRTQVCTMLGGAMGFNSQSNPQKIIQPPFIAIRHESLPRWIVTAWKPHNRSWSNPPVPCIHADPVFPKCLPDQTVGVQGHIWFFEGDDVAKFIQSLDF